jgi:phosphatidylinositol-3,4,5-trisphosphate 3-phosphatase/dual-specificity protein phosphatase PTEN
VMIDYDGTLPMRSKADSVNKQSDSCSSCVPNSNTGVPANSNRSKVSRSEDNDDVFSDSEGEETGASRSRQAQATSGAGSAATGHASSATAEKIGSLTHRTDHLSFRSQEPAQTTASKEATTDGAGKPSSGIETPNLDSAAISDIKAIAADASVFSFGDEEDFESD